MPIKPENKYLYPDNWKEISRYIIFERAKGKCEICGIKNYSIGMRIKYEFYSLGFFGTYKEALNYKLDYQLGINGKLIIIVLTTAHLDHDPTNNDYSNLKAMCQKCHNNYDIQHRKETRLKTKLKNQLSLKL